MFASAWSLTAVTNSFSHLASNLIIGLCKGSRQLHPYSQQFNRELGYSLFRLEASFVLISAPGGGRSHPDIVIVSSKVGNAILFELTEASTVGDHKEQQLIRYSLVTPADLTVVLAIPPQSAQTHDVALILSPQAIEAFNQHCLDRGWRYPLLAFTQADNGFSLQSESHQFCEPSTDLFFRNGVHITRIPQHYLPFTLDQFSSETLARHVVRHLTSLLVKGVAEVSIGDFCAGYLGLWPYIGIEKRRELERATGRILTALARKTQGRDILKRVSDSPLRWHLMDRAEFRRRMRSIRTLMEQFILQLEGKSDQPELPLEEF
jgi:hypothetical protein